MIKKLMLPAAILAAFIFSSGPAESDNERKFLLPADSSSYKIYKYPSDRASFCIPFGFEAKAKIKNGKYFYLEMEDMTGNTECNYDIHFYAPDGTRISKQNIRRPSDSFNIPVNEKSLSEDFLLIRIVNNGRETARNFKIVLAVPNEEIKGKKSKGGFESFEPEKKAEQNEAGK